MGKKFKVVGISSCAVGIAHTYMNAEMMVKEGKAYGLDVHIEKQGALGIEDEVSQQEFDEADAIVLCCGVLPMNTERFEKYREKTIEVDFNKVVKNPAIFITALKEAGLLDKDLQKI